MGTNVAHAGAEIQTVEISIVLCDDSFIRDLNYEHRGLNKATDVLSFPQDDFDEEHLAFMPGIDGGPRILGDVVISLETADAQARAAGWDIADEVDLLAIHGALHLLGYDDETVEGAAEMRERSAVVLSDLGISLPQGATHPYFIEYATPIAETAIRPDRPTS